MAAFACGSLIGVFQKIFAVTEYGNQTSAFLASASFVAWIMSSVLMKIKGGKGIENIAVSKKFIFFAAVSGICVYINNHANLYLAGALDSAIFYPLVNSIPLIICSIIAFTVFKEKFKPI